MDLKSLIASAVAATPKEEIVRGTNDFAAAADLVLTPEAINGAVVEAEEAEEALEAEVEAESAAADSINFDAVLNTTEFIEDRVAKQDDNGCAHLCDCGNWWSHGPKDKCRYPDLVKQGKCMTCLNSGVDDKTVISIEEDFKENDKGQRKLSARAQVVVRNEETKRIKDMSIEQLTHHMTFLAFRIEELRVAQIQTRHRRSELEEEQIADIPDSERAAFIEALRAGKPKKEKKAPKEKKPAATSKASKKAEAESKEKELIESITKGGRELSEAKVIASMMMRTGKSQAIVEALLYD